MSEIGSDIQYGATQKRYFFYIDEKGIHEYGAIEIREADFIQYDETNEMLKSIADEYKINGSLPSIKYMKRCNGLVHLNISYKNEDFILYKYKTYKILDDNSLELIDTGSGNYVSAIKPDIAVY